MLPQPPPSVQQLLDEIARLLPDGGISSLPQLLDELGVACDQKNTCVLTELFRLKGLASFAADLDLNVREKHFPKGQKHRNVTARLKELFANDWILPHQYVAVFGIGRLARVDFNAALVQLKSRATWVAAYNQLRAARDKRKWATNDRWTTADVLLALEHLQGFSTTRAELRKGRSKRRRKTELHPVTERASSAWQESPASQSLQHQHLSIRQGHQQQRPRSPTPADTQVEDDADVDPNLGFSSGNAEHLSIRQSHYQQRPRSPAPADTQEEHDADIDPDLGYSSGGGNGDDFGFSPGGDRFSSAPRAPFPAGEESGLLKDTPNRPSIEKGRRALSPLPDESILDSDFQLSSRSYSSARSDQGDLGYQTRRPRFPLRTEDSTLMAKRAASEPPGPAPARKGRKPLGQSGDPGPSGRPGALGDNSIPEETGLLTTSQIRQAAEFLAESNSQLGAVFLYATCTLLASSKSASDLPASQGPGSSAPMSNTWHVVPPGHLTFSPPGKDGQLTLQPFTPDTKARGHRHILVPVSFLEPNSFALAYLDTTNLTVDVFHPGGDGREVLSAIETFIRSYDFLKPADDWMTDVFDPEVRVNGADSALLCAWVALKFVCVLEVNNVDPVFWHGAFSAGFRSLLSSDDNGAMARKGSAPDATIEISSDAEASALRQELMGLANQVDNAERDAYSLETLKLVIREMQPEGYGATLAQKVKDSEALVHNLKSAQISSHSYTRSKICNWTAEAQADLDRTRVAAKAWSFWSGLARFRSQAAQHMRVAPHRGKALKKALMTYYFAQAQTIGLLDLPVESNADPESDNDSLSD
ncbi:hypothetical protein EJ03DRAFT_331464 [Teratosphaeria nubilosa]|uniref:Uncharacterized protein n=1 Tax=Teratosphaeria nubilosa TaxID=161662 RepID=A0A6G1KW65_9PEZI|nr:hypothetical protein EJ03DRAFT_331464 [Teratosphaeria nubilosa]